MQCTDKMTIKAVVLLLVVQVTVAIDLHIGEQHLEDFRARKFHCLFENLFVRLIGEVVACVARYEFPDIKLEFR